MLTGEYVKDRMCVEGANASNFVSRLIVNSCTSAKWIVSNVQLQDVRTVRLPTSRSYPRVVVDSLKRTTTLRSRCAHRNLRESCRKNPPALLREGLARRFYWVCTRLSCWMSRFNSENDMGFLSVIFGCVWECG